MIIFNIATPLEKTVGLKGIWYFVAAVCAACFVFYAAVISDLKPSSEQGATESSKTDYGYGIFKNTAMWMLILGFFGVAYRDMSYTTWAPKYFLAGTIPLEIAALIMVFAGIILVRVRSKGEVTVSS